MPRASKKSSSTSISDSVTQYAQDVLSGVIVAGPDVRNACKRHLDDLASASARGFTWNLEAALLAINFFPKVLRLNGGEFEGEVFNLLPWQMFIVGSLFGWQREDGTRRFREAYVEGGKGCGKSPMAAGIGLYMLVADGEARAEIYAAATKREQAMILFRDAVAMVKLSPDLASVIKTQGQDDRVWNIAFLRTGSFFRPIASDDGGQSGPRPHCGLVDEVHEHKTGTVINMLRAGKKGRRQPLILMITNSGFDRTSVCYELHEYGIRVAAGALSDDAFFSYVCSMDEGDDPFEDEECWVKANPSLGLTIQPTYLREQVHQARGMPSLESTVRRLNFCQWVDAENPWIGGPLWFSCEVGKPPESGDMQRGNAQELMQMADYDRRHLRSAFRGKKVFGGLDLSGTRDLTAAAFVAVNNDQTVDAFVEFWSPGETLLERSGRDKVDYEAWVRAGHMHATDGRSVAYREVARRLATLDGEMHIAGIACDPYRMGDFERDCDAEGVVLPFVMHGQGYGRSGDSGLWMPRSIELIEQLIFESRLRVVFNPCLRWNVSNAVVEADAKENRIFRKRKAVGRIDGIVALTMAVGLALNGVPAKEPEFQMFFIG